MFNYEKYCPIVKENYKSKDDLINAIAILKEAGANWIESISALTHETGIPIGELKEITLNSHTWANEKDYIEEINRIANDVWFSRHIIQDDDDFEISKLE